VPATPGGALFGHGRLVKALRPLLQSITQPTMILHPREDDIADLSNAMELQRKLGGTVELTVLEDSYHNCTIDRQRGLVVERTAEFVGRLAGEIAAPRPAANDARRAVIRIAA
jgi:carboxylesterase